LERAGHDATVARRLLATFEIMRKVHEDPS
jgi:hypothetical protein